MESHSQIVTLRVRLSKAGFWDGPKLLSRGRVESQFGDGLTFPKHIGYRQATEQIKAAVRAL